ncbi:MAG: HlyD family efflux transporter periplasmic adaptor subunit [Planctomycetota bacterium]|nr:HlyD family efflux transporter periplasmic adaptor subunit [Planctomycetota bacterium]MDA1247751.1 HlyD family efflux transporter periplasmic adaptor subunit [Planctomycetota bacterium]
MPTAVTLPACRDDLVIRKISDDEVVIKLPSRREYFSVGPVEHFLLKQLDGRTTADDLSALFEKEFAEKLTDRDIDDFLKIVRSRGLLEDNSSTDRVARPDATSESPESAGNSKNTGSPLIAVQSAADEDDDDDELSTKKQNLLFYRIPLFDPHRMFCWLEPKLRWIWTRGFVAASSVAFFLALCIVLTNGSEFASSVATAMRWETIAVIWGTIILATLLHEFAHGLTCRHYGGDVHDVGVLFMFFIPCLYCNVSDAWLIPERRKRLWITAAGGYCDLCIWAFAVFVWRVTVPGCLPNHLAFVVQAICGGRGLLNFNPLLRLDGYYIISDWLTIPNLRKRSQEHWMAHLRWLLWGAKRPRQKSRGRALLIYGVLSWCFAIFFLDLIFLRLLEFVGTELGIVGVVFTCLLLMFALRRVFKGFFKSEFGLMLKTRRKRTIAWVAGISAVVVTPFVVPVARYAAGDFEVRPGSRLEVPAPVSGFIARIYVKEGTEVEAGDLLVELASPTLESSIATKISEIEETDASLAELQLGTRPEEIEEQRKRVERLTEWVGQGEADLRHANEELAQELVVDEHGLKQTELQVAAAEKSIQRSEWLYGQGALAGTQLQQQQISYQLLRGSLMKSNAEFQAKRISGTRSAEAALARRQQERADAESTLKLLLAGTRPEVIAAQQARRERLTKEMAYLEAQKKQLTVRAPVAGVVATPRLKEKIGLLAVQGTPLCAIEDATTSRVELAVAEDQTAGIRPGQKVILKARALPFDRIEATVERVAPATTKKESGLSSVLVVHCALDEAQQKRLRSGMTGFGRVVRGSQTLGLAAVSTMLSYVRTEFWW